MNKEKPVTFWEVLDTALALPDSTRLHLTVGRPPLVRIAEKGLQPLEEFPVQTWKSIQYMLAAVVDPERWEEIEQVGEGQITFQRDTGKSLKLVLFRSMEAWSVVVHL